MSQPRWTTFYFDTNLTHGYVRSERDWRGVVDCRELGGGKGDTGAALRECMCIKPPDKLEEDEEMNFGSRAEHTSKPTLGEWADKHGMVLEVPSTRNRLDPEIEFAVRKVLTEIEYAEGQKGAKPMTFEAKVALGAQVLGASRLIDEHVRLQLELDHEQRRWR